MRLRLGASDIKAPILSALLSVLWCRLSYHSGPSTGLGLTFFRILIQAAVVQVPLGRRLYASTFMQRHGLSIRLMTQNSQYASHLFAR